MTPWFDYLIVSKEELEKILNGTGWKVHEFLDSDGAGYIVIIEKEKGGLRNMNERFDMRAIIRT